jgi:hypothetical protein
VKQPIHTIRFGLIKAAIWRNQTKVGDRHVVTVVRLFRNGDVWQESTRYGRDDLPLVSKVIDLAHTWIYQNGATSDHDGQDHTAPNTQTSQASRQPARS